MGDVSDALGSVGWGDIDEKLVLQVCKAILGADITAKSPAKVNDALEANPGVIDDAESALLDMARFLSEACHVNGPAMVPYALQAVLIAHALHRMRRGAETDRRLAQWFWATTIGEYFAGMNSARLVRTQTHLDDLLAGRVEPLPPELVQPVRPIERFDFRAARSRGLLTWLIESRPPMDAKGQPFAEPFEWLAEHGRFATPKLLRIAELGKGQPEAGPENRLIAPPRQACGFRRAFLDVPKSLSIETLESHYIDEAGRAALVRRDWSTLLARRRALMLEVEQQRARDLGVDYD